MLSVALTIAFALVTSAFVLSFVRLLRGPHAPDRILALDEQRRSLIQQTETLKAERNTVSKEIGQMKDPAARQAKIDAMRQVGDRIALLDDQLRGVIHHVMPHLVRHHRLDLR